MLVIAVVLICAVWVSWWQGNSITDNDALRNLIFAIGGVGAAIGLRFAKIRQDKFSDQVQTQIDQVKIQFDQGFNDRLGRGVELLANDKVSMRQAGLRVLDDLIKATKDSNQKQIIANLIYDFVKDRAKIIYARDDQGQIKRGGDGKEIIEKVEKTEDRQDIALAVEILMQISRDDQVILPIISDGRLRLSNLDFSHIDFSRMTFEKVGFSKSYFFETTFHSVSFEDVTFAQAKLDKVDFIRAKMKRSLFINTEISDANFRFATIENGRFSWNRIVNSNFYRTDMIECTFQKTTIDIGDVAPTLIGCFFNVGSKFKYSKPLTNNNTVNLSKCYFSKFDPPVISDNNVAEYEIDKTRGYETEYGISVFVESNKDWSLQPFDEWVAVEIAEWRLNKEKTSPKYIDNNKHLSHLKNDLKAKKEALKKAKAEFDQRVSDANKANPD